MKTYLFQKGMNLFAGLFIVFLFSFQAFAHFGSKGPFGGTVSCATTFDTTVYIGTDAGGVYSSTNLKLVGWKPIPVGLKSGRITALAHTGTNLYAATADSGIFIFNGFVGSDRYWNKVNNGLSNLDITCLIAINASTLMAGTKDGLFVTTNNGNSWAAVNGALADKSIIAMEKAGARIIIKTDGGVFVSDNNGTSWSDFNDENTAGISGAASLSYNASTNELMVMNALGLFMLTTNPISGTTAAYAPASTGLPEDVIIRSISNDGTNWYLSTDAGVFTSSTGTINWSAINTKLPAKDIRITIPFKSSLICGTYKLGVFKASKTFAGWSAMNTNFNNLVTHSMVTDGTSLVVAATENGIYVSTDIAANYYLLNKGLVDSLHVNDVVFAEKLLLAATDNMGVYLSVDTAKNWTNISGGLGNLSVKKIFHANGKFYVIDAANNIYNTDLDQQWTLLQTGLPVGVQPMSIIPYSNKILLATYGHGVFVCAAGSTSWTAINNGLPNMNVTSVTERGNKIFAGTDGSGVFVSDGSNIQWSATTPTIIEHTSLMQLYGNKIQAMGTYAGYIWASYKGGLLASSDEGATWIAGGNQFNLPSYTDVKKISFVATRVFVTTESNGLYSNALSEIPTVATSVFAPTAVNTTALGVVPNPNAGTFRLDLSSAQAPISEIVIYDYTGNVKERFTSEQEVYTLNYKQGMYVVQVKTRDNAVYTQKMIVE